LLEKAKFVSKDWQDKHICEEILFALDNYLDISGVGRWLASESQDSALLKSVVACIAAIL